MLTTVLLLVGGYLLGSLSSAIIICRLFGLPDPRAIGSGNPGATNVLRTGSKAAAAATLAGDMLKGLLPVLAGRWLGAEGAVLAASGVAAFFGHLYPVFFGFKGGKGVATSLGVLLGLAWPVGLAAVATWLGMAVLFRISSLSALTAALLSPFYFWWLAPHPAFIAASVVMSAFLAWRHRGNIQRLLAGTESKIR